MKENTTIKGYKVFNPDWTCLDFQYSCPGIFEEDVTPSVCNRGFHFCPRAVDCFNYYSFDPDNKVAEVIALGEVNGDGDKLCTNKIQIVRELSWAEVLEIVNTGKDCTGLGNSGNRNSGDWNSGNRNSGNRNSGDWNSGDWNSGDWNSGNRNSGDRNSGDRNSGDWNKTNFSNGCFNTNEPKIYLFNKPSNWTYRDWRNSDACCILSDMPYSGKMLEYIYLGDMTEDEKKAHPEAETTGGYLKLIEEREANQIWWDGLNIYAQGKVCTMPNFDRDIFKEITGIDVGD